MAHTERAGPSSGMWPAFRRRLGEAAWQTRDRVEDLAWWARYRFEDLRRLLGAGISTVRSGSVALRAGVAVGALGVVSLVFALVIPAGTSRPGTPSTLAQRQSVATDAADAHSRALPEQTASSSLLDPTGGELAGSAEGQDELHGSDEQPGFSEPPAPDRFTQRVMGCAESFGLGALLGDFPRDLSFTLSPVPGTTSTVLRYGSGQASVGVVVVRRSRAIDPVLRAPGSVEAFAALPLVADELRTRFSDRFFTGVVVGFDGPTPAVAVLLDDAVGAISSCMES